MFYYNKVWNGWYLLCDWEPVSRFLYFEKKTKMEVKIVFAKSAIVRAQLGRVCFAHQSADLYPASFGIKGTCSNIFRIISSGKSWRTFGGLEFKKE